MPWTIPKTWTVNEVLTAADMNTFVRDNMNETSAAAVTTVGDTTYADGSHSMTRLAIGAAGTALASTGAATVWRLPTEDIDFQSGSLAAQFDLTSYGTTSTAVSGSEVLPVVTVTTGPRALVIVSCFRAYHDTNGGQVFVSFSVSGATTLGAGDAQSGLSESSVANDHHAVSSMRLIPLTAGSNTFQMQARIATAGLGTIDRPRILVVPF